MESIQLLFSGFDQVFVKFRPSARWRNFGQNLIYEWRSNFDLHWRIYLNFMENAQMIITEKEKNETTDRTSAEKYQ